VHAWRVVAAKAEPDDDTAEGIDRDMERFGRR